MTAALRQALIVRSLNFVKKDSPSRSDAIKLHYHYILFADSAWLVGSSLKDAGREAFNMIELVERSVLLQTLNRNGANGGVCPSVVIPISAR